MQLAKSLVTLFLLLFCSRAYANDHVLVEAEQFDNLGGWVLDQQFMDLMGAPFLLAHGIGSLAAK